MDNGFQLSPHKEAMATRYKTMHNKIEIQQLDRQN
jgi:hypothetical protein